MLHITPSPKLSALTSLHLGGVALALVAFETPADLDALPQTVSRIGGEVVPLGGGTNILAADGELPVVLVRCGDETPPVVAGGADDRVLVRVGAGLSLPRLLAWCMKQGLTGLEGMAGVPGNVGGAVAGNAGAHGVDMGVHLQSIEIFSPDRGYRVLRRDEVCCAYRSFGLVEGGLPWFVIASATLALHRGEPAIIRRTMRENIDRKVAVQPVRAWSAGCVFKNPPSGVSAGRLLDEAGFRGKRHGGMCFSDMHANFLVNEGNGSAQAAFDLVREAQGRVLERSGIQLQTEVKLWEF